MRNIFLLTIISILTTNISYAKYYKCPKIKENVYHSIFSEIDEWQIYAVGKNNKSIYKFQTREISNSWNDYNIELTFDKDMSILYCSTNVLNFIRLDSRAKEEIQGEIRALKFVDESDCTIDTIGQGFQCEI